MAEKNGAAVPKFGFASKKIRAAPISLLEMHVAIRRSGLASTD